MPGIDETKPFIPVTFAVLTVSDTRTMDDDKSGATLVRLIEEAGHAVADRRIVADEAGQIRDQIRAWAEQDGLNAILTTGGTGLTGRDVTPEAVRPLFDKEIEGFSALMRIVSYQKVGTSTIQSRALGGIVNGVYVFCLPGSPGACRDAWNDILKLQFDARHKPCNFVEIMPRLRER